MTDEPDQHEPDQHRDDQAAARPSAGWHRLGMDSPEELAAIVAARTMGVPHPPFPKNQHLTDPSYDDFFQEPES